MRIRPEAVKKILAVRNDRFGEFLLNIPALRALKEGYPGAQLILLVSPYVKELAEAVPFADEVLEWDFRPHTLFEKLRFASFLRSRHIDMAVIFNPSLELNMLAFFAGIPARVGYDRKGAFFLNRKIKDKKGLGARHEVEYNLELASAAGAGTKDLSLSLEIGSNAVASLRPLLGSASPEDFIAVHPWTSDPVKQWPLENFKGLIGRISLELNLKVAIVGGRENAQKSAQVFSGIKGNVLDLTGKTTLLELAAFLKQSRLLISADSGPAHLACAAGGRALVLFRNDLAGKSAKRWGPWGKGNAVIEKTSLLDISVEEVFSKAKEMAQK